MKLSGQVAIVTGGGSGQGRATALLFAQEGARVVVGDINDKGAAETARLINRQEGGQAIAAKVDVTKADEVSGMVDTALSHYGRLDILINNAGIGSGGAAGKRETSQDGHELRFAVNYLAGFLLTRALLPLLMLGKPARIVNVSSLGQHPIDFDDVMLTRGYSGSRAYAQSKKPKVERRRRYSHS